MKQTDYGSIRALPSSINPRHSPASERTPGSWGGRDGAWRQPFAPFRAAWPPGASPFWRHGVGAGGCTGWVQGAARAPVGCHSRGRAVRKGKECKARLRIASAHHQRGTVCFWKAVEFPQRLLNFKSMAPVKKYAGV